jgi:sugar phosphate isomerase/epimerase
MKFGVSTYFLKERSLPGALELIARLGYASAEIWMEHYLASGQRPATIARRARELGIGLTVHASSYDLNILSTNAGIRRESLRQVHASLRLAAELGATVATVHPGALSSAREDQHAAWRYLEETAAILDQWAGESGIRVGIENMENRGKEIFCLPADVARLLEPPRRHLCLTLDLAHTQTHMDPLAYVKQIPAQWIGHVHLSDNGPSATHLPLGQGELPVEALLKALGRVYSGIVSLEGYIPGKGESLLSDNMHYLRRHGLIMDI